MSERSGLGDASRVNSSMNSITDVLQTRSQFVQTVVNLVIVFIVVVMVMVMVMMVRVMVMVVIVIMVMVVVVVVVICTGDSNQDKQQCQKQWSHGRVHVD